MKTHFRITDPKEKGCKKEFISALLIALAPLAAWAVAACMACAGEALGVLRDFLLAAWREEAVLTGVFVFVYAASLFFVFYWWKMWQKSRAAKGRVSDLYFQAEGAVVVKGGQGIFFAYSSTAFTLGVKTAEILTRHGRKEAISALELEFKPVEGEAVRFAYTPNFLVWPIIYKLMAHGRKFKTFRHKVSEGKEMAAAVRRQLARHEACGDCSLMPPGNLLTVSAVGLVLTLTGSFILWSFQGPILAGGRHMPLSGGLLIGLLCPSLLCVLGVTVLGVCVHDLLQRRKGK